MDVNKINVRTWSKLGARGTLGVALLDLAKTMDNLIVMTADLSTTSGVDRFAAAYPEKFLNLGIAENNMVNVAAGMANNGFVPFITSFANFLTMRSYEQVRLSMGYMNLNVKLVGLASGMAIGMFGNTHYGIEDISLMRSIPNMTIVCPCDGLELVKTVALAAKTNAPMYIRLTGEANAPIVYNEDFDFEIGKGITLCEGTDITIFSHGTMVYECLSAVKILAEKGVFCTLVDMHTIKPLDTDLVDKACKNSKLIVSVEEHSKIGGLGGAIAEYIVTIDKKPPQLFIGLPDAFGKAGEYQFLLKKYGLKAESIAETILNKINKN